MFYLMASLAVILMVFTEVQVVGEAGQLTDFLSSFLIVLSFFIGGLILRGTWAVKIARKRDFLYLVVCVVIVFLLLVTFKVSNLLYFYIFFEAGLIPIFLLILG